MKRTTTDLQSFIVEHVQRVEPLMRDGALAVWEASTTGSEEANDRAARLRAELMRVYANRAEYDQLCEWDLSPPADPLLVRQLRLLRLAYAQGQQDEQTIEALANLEKELLSAFVNFRGVCQGKSLCDNELVNLLNAETDSARLQEAWEASKQIGPEVSDNVLQAVGLRNAASQRMGYDDYYRQSQALAEIDEARLFEILDELQRLTDEPYRQVKAELDQALAHHYGVAVDQLRPWHYGEPLLLP